MRDAAWFIAGFLTRAAIAFVSDLTWQWRWQRAMRRNANGKDRAMRWRVKITGIVWDDGKGEYDVSDLPSEWSSVVIADDEKTALEYALTDASDSCGSLIQGFETTTIKRMK